MAQVGCGQLGVEQLSGRRDQEVNDPEPGRLTGLSTKRETVDYALRELVARQRRLGVLTLRGAVHWEGDLARSRRGRASA